MMNGDKVIINIGVVVISGLRALSAGKESVVLGHLQAGRRVPREVIAEEHRVHVLFRQIFVGRAEVRRQLLLGQPIGDPVSGRRAMSDSPAFQPLAIEAAPTRTVSLAGS